MFEVRNRRKTGRMILVFSAIVLLFATIACERESSETRYIRYLPNDIPDEFLSIRYRIKWQHQAQFAGSYMALEKGFYQKRGLDVQILPGGVNYPPYQSLINGECEISNNNLFNVMERYHEGPPLVNLAQISQSNSTLLVAKKTSGISTLNDMQGKRIGIWRDEPGDYIRLFFEHVGLDVQIILMDWSVNLLLNDAVDVMNAMTYNEYHRILMSGLDEDDLVVFDLADYGFNLIDDGLYTTRDFYEKHTQECIAFAEATLEGWLYAFDHKEETLDVVLRYLKQNNLPVNRGHQAWMLDHMHNHIFQGTEEIGLLAEEDFDFAQDILMKYGWLTQSIDYSSFYPHATGKKD